MPSFELSLAAREKLWVSGWGEIDAALRFAAVDRELWSIGAKVHWLNDSDGEQRHFTNFLSWADAALAGIDRAIKRAGESVLLTRWDALGTVPLRREMRELRNLALKDRRDVAPRSIVARGDGGWSTNRQVDPAPRTGDPAAVALSQDYLVWIRSEPFELACLAIDAGSLGPNPPLQELPIHKQMPFPKSDPWTVIDDPEFRAIFEAR